MKRVVMGAALAGMAVGSAAAQNISTDLVVSLTFDRTAIAVGETATATITASWNGVTGSYLSSLNIDLIASHNSVQVSNIATIAWNNPALGFDGQGVASGADVMGLQASQFSLIPPFNSSNPILVTTFTVTGTGGPLTYSAQTAAGAPFAFSVTGPVFSDPVVQFGTEVFQSGTLFPAPGAVSALGGMGLLALRRRR